MKIQTYSANIEVQMCNFYNSLSEKDHRRYVAIEATNLGYGGVSYICQILHGDNRTITRGQQELKINMQIQFDKFLPQWNYVAIPFSSCNSIVSRFIKS
jgi:hypothetical protein